MIQRQQLLMITTIVPALALLASCGQNNPGNGTGEASPPPTATSGPVTLSIGAPSYHINETIEVTLRNSLTSSIYFQDHLTNCTVIQLQHQTNNSWETVNKCLLLIATHWHKLDAGQHLTVKLVPSSSRPWIAGLYRTTLRYGISPTSGSSTAIYSTEFQVT